MITKTARISPRQMDAFIVGFFTGSAYAGMFDDPKLSQKGEDIRIKPGETAYGLAARLLDVDSACGALIHTCERARKIPVDLVSAQAFLSIIGYNYRNVSPLNHHPDTMFCMDRLDDTDTIYLIVGAKAGVRHQEETHRMAESHTVMEWSDKDGCRVIPGLDLDGAAAKLMGNTNPTVEELMNAIG